jgi:septal ring factor EnvC (AmiA/AmiB activator)
LLALTIAWPDSVISALAESPLSDVREHIQSTRKTHEALQAVRDGLNGQLSELELKQAELAKTLGELEAQSRVRERRLGELKAQRGTLQESIRQQQRQLTGQLRSAHIIGHRDWLKLLLNQEDPSRLARVLAYYGYLNQARTNLIQNWQGDLAKARDTEAELAGETAQLAEVRQHTKQERAALKEATSARRQLLVSWDKELKGQAASLAQLKEDEARLAGLLQSMTAYEHEEHEAVNEPPSVDEPPQQLAGTRQCPPAGVIVAKYGSPRMSGRWDGLLIQGKEGAPVRAVAEGKVVFADWFRGYGLLLIVDHGKEVMTLYAFNQTLYKHKDDSVHAGDLIAAVGVSGGRDKPGLYFGVRRQGQPIDPHIWCSEQG